MYTSTGKYIHEYVMTYTRNLISIQALLESSSATPHHDVLLPWLTRARAQHIGRYLRCVRTLVSIFVAIYGVPAPWWAFLSLFTVCAHIAEHNVICRYLRCVHAWVSIFVAIYGVCAPWWAYLSLFTVCAHLGGHICRYLRCVHVWVSIFVAIYGVRAHCWA